MKFIFAPTILALALTLLIGNVTSLEAENIQGGKSIKRNKFSNFAYSVSVRVGYGDNKEFVCGGALVAPNIVLTAAHCVYNVDTKMIKDLPFVVVAGTTECTQQTGHNRVVRNIYYHQQFDGDKYDFAVLLLEKDFPVDGESIALISLPRLNIDYAGKLALAGKSAQVIGFGESKAEYDPKCKKSLNDKKLRYAETTITDHKLCHGYIDRICTSGLTNCYGDGGSPLVYQNTVVGIAKRTGSDTCIKEKVGLFTNVAYLVDFVHAIQNNRPSVYMKSQSINGFVLYQFPLLNIEITTNSQILKTKMEFVKSRIYSTCQSLGANKPQKQCGKSFLNFKMGKKPKQEPNSIESQLEGCLWDARVAIRDAIQNNPKEPQVLRNMCVE